MNQRRARTGFLFSLPALIIVMLILVIPVIYSFGLSAFKYDLIRPNAAMTFLGLGNYNELLGDSTFHTALGNTLLYLFVIVTLELIIGFAIALLLNSLKTGNFFSVLILLPSMIAPAVVAATFDFLFNESLGPVNYWLQQFGLSSVPWFSNGKVAFFSIALVDIWQWSPYIMLMLYAGLQGLSQEVYDAAAVDGANSIQTLFSITLPMMKPIVIVAVLLRAINVTKLFETVTLLTYGGPGNATITTAFYSYTVGFKFFRIGYSAAIGVITLVVFSFLIVLIYRSLKEREHQI